MALPVWRWSCRGAPPVLNSYFRLNSLIQNRAAGRGLAPLSAPVSAAAVAGCGGRCYSSERGDGSQPPRIFFVGIPNPIIWVRTRIYYFLIRSYFDREFSIEDFSQGAKQAFSHVSCLLSQCKFEALEGLVAKDLIGKLKEKCADLSLNHKKALSASPDEIMYATPADVSIYYDDDNERKFVSILMRFWYMTSIHLPEDSFKGAPTFEISIGEDGEKKKSKRLLIASYEFQREFTQGVNPDWTITRIEHAELLN